jgi:hypothetical protein
VTAQTVSLPSRRTDGIAPVGRAASQATVVEQSRAVAEVAAAVQVAQAFYAVPNRGEGLSIHIMRELARIWGNVDYGVRELRRDDADDVAGVSEMQAWAWDQQTNTRSTRSFIQPHAKSTRKGRVALTDINDVYLNNQNTGARAVRECIASVIPDWVIAEAEQICRKTLEHGEGKSVEERSREAVTAFAAHGVTRAQIEDFLGAKYGKWTPVQLGELQRVYVSITQDGIAASEFFPERAVEVESVTPAKASRRKPAPEPERAAPAPAETPAEETFPNDEYSDTLPVEPDPAA